MPQAQLPLHELEDPDLRGATAAGGGGEPPRTQGLAHLEGTGDPDPRRQRGRRRHPLSLARPRRWQPGRGPTVWQRGQAPVGLRENIPIL
jgi:hypothetical protein